MPARSSCSAALPTVLNTAGSSVCSGADGFRFLAVTGTGRRAGQRRYGSGTSFKASGTVTTDLSVTT